MTNFYQPTALSGLLAPLGIDRHAGPGDGFALRGLPGAIRLRGHDAVVVATDEPAPNHRVTVRIAAADRRLDIVLLRVERGDDGAVAVSADLTLAAPPHAPWSFTDLGLWAGGDGDVWLVPAALGPTVAVTGEGFTLEMVPPYATSAERTVGVLRAGAGIACRLVEGAR